MRNLLSEGDFEGKDRTGFGFTEVPTLLANSFFNPFPHELRVANAISKNRSQLSIVFAGVFQHSARGREGERPNRQQEIHNKLINNKYEKEKQRERALLGPGRVVVKAIVLAFPLLFTNFKKSASSGSGS